MEFVNLSDKALKFSGSKKGLKKMILLPDYCPGAGGLPVGVVAVYDRKGHNLHTDYLGPDVGCGMTFAKFRDAPENGLEHLTYSTTNELASYPKNGKVSLGGGNHFINFYEVEKINDGNEELDLNEKDNVVLVHSGSGKKGKEFYEANLTNNEYIAQYDQITELAKKNREGLIGVIKKMAGVPVDILFDRNHNSIEFKPDEIIYRKGTIELHPNQYALIPSSMAGDALLIKGKQKVSELENSMAHGTGRKMSRGEAKTKNFTFDKVREKIYLPSFIPDDHIRTEHPRCYRTIEDILPAIKDYVEVVGVLKPLAGIL